MVSTKGWARSSSSSSSVCSSRADSYEQYLYRHAEPIGESDRNDVDLSVEDVSEAARRVLEDLEDLCLDNDDEESDDDEFDAESESEFETSSQKQSRHRGAGGMTLKELTVVVNASIGYHFPTKLVTEKPPRQRSQDKVLQPRPCHQQKKSPKARKSEETAIGVFQELLERKERQFYARRSEDIARNSNSEPTQTPEPPVAPAVMMNRQQQTMTAHVRDQSTETENLAPLPVAPAPLIAMEDLLPPQAPSLRENEVSLMPRHNSPEFAAVGPTLADVERCRLRKEKDRLSSSSFSEFSLQSSLSSPTSSATPASLISSSATSNRSTGGSNSIDSHSSRGLGDHKHRTSSKSVSCSRTSTKSSKNDQSLQANHTRPVSPVQQRTRAKQCQATTTSDIAFEEGDSIPLQLSSNVPQVLSSPALVTWELDLSNFTP